MPTTFGTQENPSKYNKRIEDLIEDAEIEAELEAERHIRIKNAKWVLISSTGLLFLGILYFWTDSKPNIEEFQPESSVAEIALLEKETEVKPIPFLQENSQKYTSGKPTNLMAKLDALEKNQTKVPAIPLQTEAPPKTLIEMPNQKADKPLIEISTPNQPTKLLKKVASKKTTTIKKREKLQIKSKTITRRGNYSIQLGAFSIKANAKDFVKKVKQKGIKPIIDERQAKKTNYSVITGEFNNKESGQTVINGLKKAGFNPELKEISPNQFSLIAGEFPTRKKAEKLRSELSNRGFLSSVLSKKIEQTTYAVQFGSFSNLKQAKTSQIKLNQLGIKKTFIKRANRASS